LTFLSTKTKSTAFQHHSAVLVPQVKNSGGCPSTQTSSASWNHPLQISKTMQVRIDLTLQPPASQQQMYACHCMTPLELTL
jgi:hypothetical protein